MQTPAVLLIIYKLYSRQDFEERKKLSHSFFPSVLASSGVYMCVCVCVRAKNFYAPSATRAFCKRTFFGRFFFLSSWNSRSRWLNWIGLGLLLLLYYYAIMFNGLFLFFFLKEISVEITTCFLDIFVSLKTVFFFLIEKNKSYK